MDSNAQLQTQSISDSECNSTSLTEVFNNPLFGDLTVISSLDNSPMFIAGEVAKALGYKNHSKAVYDHVDDEDKVLLKRSTLGGEQQVTTINESGLYALIFSSKLPNAKAFKRWVTTEVLPSIRKHGGYTAGQEELSPDELLAKAVLVAESRIKEQELENKRLNRVLNDLTQQFVSGVTIPVFCMQLNGVNIQQVQNALANKGVLIRVKHGYRPASPFRNSHFKFDSYQYAPGKERCTPVVTELGGTYLYKMYRGGDLPMRKDWNGSYTTSQLTQKQLKSLH